MVKFNQQLVLIFILLALGKSFSHARQVKEVTVAATEKEFAVEEDSNFSLQKEILDAVPNAAEVETFAQIGGRKMINETRKKSKETTKEQVRNSKKVSMASSAAAHSVGNRKGDGEENWKDNFMAFSADYRSPKSHPPKNN
ncbi:hypothetical protein Pfo_011419 [Paulownia fortunei]|nr:hypothetical protein Pfo_011419 [Paulownia fortunei]